MRRQERDFFVFLAPYLTDEERSRFRSVRRGRIADALGPQLCGDLVAKIQSNFGFRRELLGDMRRAAWWIRNGRWSERPSPVAQVAFFWEGLALLEASGALVDDLLALAHCSLSGCVCDGCDVHERLDYVEPPALVFGTLWRESLETALDPLTGVVAQRGGVKGGVSACVDAARPRSVRPPGACGPR